MNKLSIITVSFFVFFLWTAGMPGTSDVLCAGMTSAISWLYEILLIFVDNGFMVFIDFECCYIIFMNFASLFKGA